MGDVYHVEIARAAARKLAAHVAFLARIHNAAALRLYNSIFADICELKDRPNIYARYNSKRFPERELHKKLSARRYLIVFAVDESKKTVTVTDIQDCRQDIDKKLM